MQNTDGYTENEIATQVIGDADATIDGYIGSIYALPLTTTPATIKRLSTHIGAFYLMLRSGATSEELVNWRAIYSESIRYLEAVAAGKIGIPGLTGSTASLLVASAADTTRDHFTNDTLDNGDSFGPSYWRPHGIRDSADG